MTCDKLINWLEFKPTDKDLSAMTGRLAGAVALRTFLIELVRHVLGQHPWDGRTDLAPAFDTSRRYANNEVVELPDKDPHGFNPDSWRIGEVTDIEEVENPCQDKFQIVAIESNSKREEFAAGVKDGRLLTPEFPPDDEDDWSTLAGMIVDTFLPCAVR